LYRVESLCVVCAVAAVEHNARMTNAAANITHDGTEPRPVAFAALRAAQRPSACVARGNIFREVAILFSLFLPLQSSFSSCYRPFFHLLSPTQCVFVVMVLWYFCLCRSAVG
jgi:hypothetical protein